MKNISIDTFAPKRLLLLGLFTGLLGAGCSSGSSSGGTGTGTGSSGAVYGSCSFAYMGMTQKGTASPSFSLPACYAIMDPSNPGEEMVLKSECAYLKGTLSTATSCSTSNALGTCTTSSWGEITLYQASGVTVMDAELSCGVTGGTWGPA
jgi:hypothetical protein